MQKNFLFWAWKINILGLYIRKGVQLSKKEGTTIQKGGYGYQKRGYAQRFPNSILIKNYRFI